MLYRFKKISGFSRYRRRHTVRRGERIQRERLDDAALLALLFLPSTAFPNETLPLAPYSAHGATIALPQFEFDDGFGLAVA